MVVADSRRIAEDALALIALDLEELPAVTDPVAGLEPGAPKARLGLPGQSRRHGRASTTATSTARSPRPRIASRRASACTRAAAIRSRRAASRCGSIRSTTRMTIYANTQMPHRAKQILVAALGIGEQRIRVVAPDTGGGFGPKAAFHPEELALPAAALLLRRPLKWIEDRRENFVAAVGERDQDWDMEMAVDADGRMLALRGQALPRPRLLHALWRGAGLQRRHQRGRSLRAAGLSARHQLVPDQLRAVRADARRRPPAGHVCDGAAARRRRGKARHRARRGAPPQHDPAGADAVCDADQAARRLDHDLRQRRLSGVPAPRARRRRLGGFPGAAGRGAKAGPLSRPRPRQLCRGHRARAVRERGASRRRVGQDRHHHRRQRAGPGHQDRC